MSRLGRAVFFDPAGTDLDWTIALLAIVASPEEAA